MRNLALVFVLASFVAVEATLTCPTGAVPSLGDGSLCYSFLSSSTEFLNAEQTCVDLGGHLASIDSAFTDTFLNRKL